MVTPNAGGLNCPSCGAAIALLAGALAETVACPNCHALLDARDPQLAVLQQFEGKMKFTPDIPLGTRGTFKGDACEVIGFEVRGTISEKGERYWREYLLWNPYKGVRRLTEHDGHWNDVVAINVAPDEKVNGRQPLIELNGDSFQHFGSTLAKTEFILGEFPSRVRVGDRVNIREFVAPPHVIVEEIATQKKSWSLGTYTAPDHVWEAFALPGAPPARSGTYANQPDPFDTDWKRAVLVFGIPAMVGLFLIAAGHARFFAAAVVVLALLRGTTWLRYSKFERARWRDSDYPTDETAA